MMRAPAFWSNTPAHPGWQARLLWPLSALYAAADAGGGVQLMTIHKAKGLEFDHVFLPGLLLTGQALIT